MPARTGILPVAVRLAVYASAILVVFLARLPAPSPEATAMLRPAAEATREPSPSPVRLVLAGVLLTGMLFERAGRRPRC
jgi:hypothetical protein